MLHEDASQKASLDDPELFFKTQRQAQEKAPAGTGAELLRDLEMVAVLFHLLVPGGKWHTAILMPVSSASFCSSTLHSLRRGPLLPLHPP